MGVFVCAAVARSCRSSRSEDLCKTHIQTNSFLRLIHFPVQYVGSFFCVLYYWLELRCMPAGCFRVAVLLKGDFAFSCLDR